jgi:hypothetical protein
MPFGNNSFAKHSWKVAVPATLPRQRISPEAGGQAVDGASRLRAVSAPRRRR